MKCLIVTQIAYPFGGGEQYLLETMSLFSQTYWISFNCIAEDGSLVPFETTQICKVGQNGYLIKVEGGWSEQVLAYWLRLLRPDLVHHQGSLRLEIYDVVKSFRIPFLTGIHFWNGILKLSAQTQNRDILDHLSEHCPETQFLYLKSQPECHFYTASPFVSQVIEQVTGHLIEDSILPSSRLDSLGKVSPNKITMINLHTLKGLDLFLHCVSQLPQYQFLGVITEPDSVAQEKIEQAHRTYSNLTLMKHQKEVNQIYRQTKVILIPSLVDETFCRVANEALFHGIPLITTGKGYIRQMVGESYPLILSADQPERWTQAVVRLMEESDFWLDVSQSLRDRYKNCSYQKSRQDLLKLSARLVGQSKAYRILIIAPWCDQGLGIQARTYSQILLQLGYQVTIFSYQPYYGSIEKLQTNPEEWKEKEGLKIYYSSHHREQITDAEIIEVVNKYDIGQALLLETCWSRIFQIAQLLKQSLQVKTYAIPNIEIVRRSEVYLHDHFDRILANNRVCYQYFKERDYPVEYLGFDLTSFLPYKKKERSSILSCLCLGGMNAFTRKNIPKICAVFSRLPKDCPLHLTCTVQNGDPRMIHLPRSDRITYIDQSLSYDQILELYEQHDLVIQVSRCEGLGLGFYEALASGKPVLTVDLPPYNELIQEGVNGWTLRGQAISVVDNAEAVISGVDFQEEDLEDKLLQIASQSDPLPIPSPKVVNSLIYQFPKVLGQMKPIFLWTMFRVGSNAVQDRLLRSGYTVIKEHWFTEIPMEDFSLCLTLVRDPIQIYLSALFYDWGQVEYPYQKKWSNPSLEDLKEHFYAQEWEKYSWLNFDSYREEMNRLFGVDMYHDQFPFEDGLGYKNRLLVLRTDSLDRLSQVLDHLVPQERTNCAHHILYQPLKEEILVHSVARTRERFSSLYSGPYCRKFGFKLP